MKIMRSVVICLVLFAMVFSGCGKKEAPQSKEDRKKANKTDESSKSDGTAEDSVQHEVLSFNLGGLTDKGDKKWEVTGQSAESVSETQMKLKNIVAKAYGDEAEATITAEQGVYDKAKNNVRLEKNVNAVIDSADKGVGKDYLDFSNGLGEATDPNTPQGGKSSEGKKKTHTVITCDGEVQFDYEQNQAYFNRNVKVKSDEFDIDADKITVYLDNTTKRVREIAATGNVKITRGENTTYSDKATYLYNEKKIVLTGKPKIVIYQEGGLEANFLEKK